MTEHVEKTTETTTETTEEKIPATEVKREEKRTTGEPEILADTTVTETRTEEKQEGIVSGDADNS